MKRSTAEKHCIHRQYRRGGQHDDTYGINAPNKQRQSRPGHSRRAQAMYGHNKIQRGHDRRKAVDEYRHCRGEYIPVCVQGGIRRIEGPPGIDPAHDQRVEQHQSRKIEDVPARQINSWKCQIVRPDRHRDKEIAERGRDRRDQKEPNHDDAVHREHAIVHRGLQQPSWRRQIQPHQCCGETPNKKEKSDRPEKQQRDALMIASQQP